MSLTRRDRAACVLALECLRIRDLRWAVTALGMMTWRPGERSLVDALNQWAISVGGWDSRRLYAHDRLLRARLALYLRALLRADAGAIGRRRCVACGERWTVREPSDEGVDEFWCGHERLWRTDGPGVWDRRITPLWQSPNLAARAAEAKKRLAKGKTP